LWPAERTGRPEGGRKSLRAISHGASLRDVASGETLGGKSPADDATGGSVPHLPFCRRLSLQPLDSLLGRAARMQGRLSAELARWSQTAQPSLRSISQNIVLRGNPEKRLPGSGIAHLLGIDPHLFGACAPALDQLLPYLFIRLMHRIYAKSRNAESVCKTRRRESIGL